MYKVSWAFQLSKKFNLQIKTSFLNGDQVMEKERIEKEMHRLEVEIHYHFHDISKLSIAMGSIKQEVQGQGKNGSEYANEGLATVGDAVLKAVIADKLYSEDKLLTKGKITAAKSDLESNATMHDLMEKEGWKKYAYNNLHFSGDPQIPDSEKVVFKRHDPYVEAIVGAFFTIRTLTRQKCGY